MILYWWFQTFGFFHHIWDSILPNLTFIFFKIVFKPPANCNIKYPLALHFVVGSLFSATASLDRDTLSETISRFSLAFVPMHYV